MPLADVLKQIEPLAPLMLAESWDPVGLVVGDEAQVVTRALLCIDLSEAVVAEAVDLGCELIVCYHPPIFKGVSRLTEATADERRLRRTLEAGLALYAPHTALDAVRGGVCDWLCDGLCGDVADGASDATGSASGIPGASSTKGNQSVPIAPKSGRRDEYKVVVYVPEAEEPAVREAMTAAGAGGIGAYRGCSFAAAGTGGFEPQAGANPTVGAVGKREAVNEMRLEMLVPGRALAAVLTAIRATHSYEEPAIDVFRLEVEPVPPTEAAGAGRILTLAEPVSLRTLAERVKQHLGLTPSSASLRITGHDEQRIQTIAVCPGAGGSLFEAIPNGKRPDAFLTGELRHHDILALSAKPSPGTPGSAIMLPGHTNTERPYLPVYRDRLVEVCGAVEWMVSAVDENPWRMG